MHKTAKEGNDTAMITIIAEFDVKPECKDEFISLAADCTKNTQKETGNLSYRVFSERYDDTKFTFIEEWANDTAIEKHNGSAHFGKFIEAIKPLIKGEPKIKQIMRVARIR